MQAPSEQKQLIDRFGRRVSYLRISVTDRCDFRCVYCMEEDTQFVPRKEVLSLEEIELVAKAFVSLGVQKVRLTGGEPLVRSSIDELCGKISRLDGLEQLVMTSNGSQLERYAKSLQKNGLKRINISLDTLREDRFKELTRTGNLNQVLSGIDAALAAGFERIKLNAVIMRGRNEDEVTDLIEFAIAKKIDISFIEEMPLGEIQEHDREESFVSSDELRAMAEEKWNLSSLDAQLTDGPARSFELRSKSDNGPLPTRLGFISPHSHNFCGDCNRVRVTAEGRLLLCLGNEHSVDLKKVVREAPGDLEKLRQVIINAMDLKPERHYFDLSEQPQILRFMSATGG